MIPVAFAGCFGWLHPGSGSRGVVLCPAFGHENMTAHRGWIRLADQLAASGFPVLRFDYPGTGDSAGSEADPDRLAAWRDSIPEAVRHLRNATGVGTVVLVGLRLGATLALLAAKAVDGVDGIACLAPVLSGRSYVRELSLLAKTWRAINLLPDVAQSGNHLDVVGERMTAQTLSDLSRLDLKQLQVRAGSVLLMQDGQSADDLAARLESQGCRVSRQTFPGVVDYLQDGLSSRIPQQAFDMVTQWCEQLPIGPLPAPHPAGRPSEGPLVLPGMTEQPFSFGPANELFGILCCPTGNSDQTKFTVIMPNTGFGRHIGDGRVFVTLARRLAALGVSSLRMDFAGFGDSAAAPDGDLDPYARRNVQDVVAAVSALNAAGHADPVVIGICSGAYAAFHATLRDPRIRAMILVNLQKFIWVTNSSLKVGGGRQRRPLGFYLRAATRRTAWIRLAKGEIAVGAVLMTLCRRPAARLYRRLCHQLERVTGIETRSGQIMRWFRALKSREVRIGLLYSEGDPGLSEITHYFGRGRKRFHQLPNVQVSLLSAADHALLEYDARLQFIEKICRIVNATDTESSWNKAADAADPLPPDLAGLPMPVGMRMKASLFSRS